MQITSSSSSHDPPLWHGRLKFSSGRPQLPLPTPEESLSSSSPSQLSGPTSPLRTSPPTPVSSPPSARKRANTVSSDTVGGSDAATAGVGLEGTACSDPKILESRISNYLASCENELVTRELRLWVGSENTVYESPLFELLSSRRVHWSTDIDEQTCRFTLIVRSKTMAESAVHNATYLMGQRTNNEMMIDPDFLTPDEKRIIHFAPIASFLPSEKEALIRGGHNAGEIDKKPPAVRKASDSAFFPTDALFPGTVFEAGFDEKYRGLERDRDQWLKRTDGMTPLVVITCATENNKILARRKRERRQKRREARREVRCNANNQTQQGTTGAASSRQNLRNQDEQPDVSDSEHESHTSDYQAISCVDYIAEHDSIDPLDHVGPIDVFMELWRLNQEGIPVRVGPRHWVLRQSKDPERKPVLHKGEAQDSDENTFQDGDTSSEDEDKSSDNEETSDASVQEDGSTVEQGHPYLTKGDLFPPRYKASNAHVPAEPDKKFYFDLDAYRADLIRAIQKLAHERMRIPGYKKRMREAQANDPDYSDSQAVPTKKAKKNKSNKKTTKKGKHK